MTEQLKKFKFTWQERRFEHDQHGDETDRYLENLHEVIEAADEDAAHDIWEAKHAESAVTGAPDACIEVV